MSDKTVANCAIVIPIYKENPSDDEVCALRQCLSVLGTYRIIFVTPRKLNHDAYLRICSEYDVSVSCETFGTKFFSDINGYNALLVSGEFYKRFLKYEYILIYQLDAFVFENKLAFWCERNYDYIGGPFFDLQRGAAAPRHTDFINGGLSLRKTNVFYQLAKTKLRLNFFFYLAWSRYDALLKQRSIIGFFKLVSFYCWMKFLCKIFNAEFGEDFIWTSLIRKHGKIAPFDDALRFSFDSCPEYAFKLNRETLPFGCHGWTAYYNRLFWDGFMTKSFAALKKPNEYL